MSKVFCRENVLNQKLLEGIDILADNVASTMGPRGRTVIIHEKGRRPFATKDGVTVAKFVNLEDPVQNVAAEIMKQAAEETANNAGDGTTTSTVLAHAIASQALQATAYASTNATQVKKGIEEAVKAVVAELKEMSTPITDEKQIKQIANNLEGISKWQPEFEGLLSRLKAVQIELADIASDLERWQDKIDFDENKIIINNPFK